jgi:imidazolonepropionase-like amidohydrolase
MTIRRPLPARSRLILLLLVLFLPSCKPRSTAEFITIKDPVIALTHIRVIDGTGAKAREDQTIIIDSGRIAAVGPTAEISVPASATTLDLSGHTAMPGLVGMHNHLFYAMRGGDHYVVSPESFPPLYLAAGVTTIRTAGAMKLDTDRAVKMAIDEGKLAGPKIHISSPYIDRHPSQTVDPQKITDLINKWAGEDVTSLKVYENITGAELRSIVEAAHKHGIKVTGHVCAMGFVEAAQAGIDNLEHGLAMDTEFFSEKKAGVCPDRSYWLPEVSRIDVKSEPVQAMIRELVNRRVAVTGTLSILETFVKEKFQLDPRMQAVLSEAAFNDCRKQLEEGKADPRWSRVWEAALKREMEFEREFVKAGGLLMAGVDPTGWGGVVAGYGDQRNIELLVEAGFTPEEAIRIATLNGATFLGEDSRIGSLAAGKQADIVIVRGNPATNIRDIRSVQLVLKDGVGYDPAKLIESIRGLVGKK